MEPERYDYCKVDKLPRELSFVCKKSDIDAWVDATGGDPPFHRVWMSMSRSPLDFRRIKREASQREAIEVASAISRYTPAQYFTLDGRRICRELTIHAVPRELAAEVRALMRDRGLKLLIDWLQEASTALELWKTLTHKVALIYHRVDHIVALEHRAA
jgi:hypothetical protein